MNAQNKIIITIVLIVMITIVIITQSQLNKEQITIEITQTEFLNKPGSLTANNNTKKIEINVHEGESFVTSDYINEKIFTLKEIQTINTATITYSEHLSPHGSGIKSKPSQIATISTTPLCFTTRTYDAGESICIRIKNNNPYETDPSISCNQDSDCYCQDFTGAKFLQSSSTFVCCNQEYQDEGDYKTIACKGIQKNHCGLCIYS